MINRLLVFLLLVYVSSLSYAQKDMIMFRDGKQMNVTIVQVNKEFVVYKLSNKKKASTEQVDSRSVYMIHYEERGNQYFTKEGDRFSGEKQKIDNDADLIYLIEGGELMAYELTLESNQIKYKASNKKKTPFSILPKDKVFLIKYKDGAVDIITAFPQPTIQNDRVTSNESSIISVNPVSVHNSNVTNPINNSQESQNTNVSAPSISTNNTNGLNFDPNSLPDVPFQATIFTTDGWTIKALVKEVGNGMLKYTKISSPKKAAQSLSYGKIKKITVL